MLKTRIEKLKTITCKRCGKTFKVCSKLNTEYCASCVYVEAKGRIPIESAWQLCIYCSDRICIDHPK